jgi:SEC-C motif-containing protein
MECPCCSGKKYEACCAPVIRGQRKAASAEELMRSRYSAYALGEIDWVIASQAPEGREYVDRRATEEWSKRSTWKSLEVLETQGGGPEDSEGFVEFKANYELAGEDIKHHEVASFRKEDDTWYFVDGVEVKPRPYKRTGAKVGPNDPCTCGSAKKFKKCCGKPGAAV